jgi:mannosyltransferase
MAIPRPIRLLAAATMALFVFLVIQIMCSPGSMQLPGSADKGVKIEDMTRDPNLDGMPARGHRAPRP